MFGFLNKKISMGLGIIILLLVVGFFGAVIYRQFYRLMEIRTEMINSFQ
jgi:hypothetical protein